MRITNKTVLFFILAILNVANVVAGSKKKPNIVLFYMDDWSWCGTPIKMNDDVENSMFPAVKMPNLESIAKDGMKFNNAYGSPQCAPARVCVQTGQSSPRNGFTVFMNGKEDYYDTKKLWESFPLVPNVSDPSIDKDAVTIPEALKDLGYVSAHIGKWHMRGNPADEGYVVHDGDTDNKPGNTFPKEDKLFPATENIKDPKLMFSVTEKAVKFIEDQAKKDQPFYCQISHYALHEWRECLAETREKYVNHPLVQDYYKSIKKNANTVPRRKDPAVWMGMAEDVDGRIGVVLDKIKELGIDENTYVVVVSDNGYRHHLLTNEGFKQPLHGHKWWLWQGGVRVPMFVKGPGIKEGSVFKPNVVNYDLLPTFYQWAGGNPSDLKNIDGVSLAGYLKGENPKDDFVNRNLYFHYPHYRETMPHSSVISGGHKVIHFYEKPDIPMLFEVNKDFGEVSNIAEKKADVHKKLYDEMMAYLKEVGARFPKENPNFNASEYKNDKKSKYRELWGPFKGKRKLDEDE